MNHKIILGLSVLAFAFVPAAKKVNLQFKLEKGKTYHQTISLKSNTTQTISGQVQSVVQVISNKLSVKLKSDEMDKETYTLNYENIQMDFEQGANKQSFNSDTTQLEMVDPMSRMFTSMTGEDFDAVINRKGEVKSVSGLEEIITSATSQLGPQGAALAPQLASNFGDEGLIKSIETLTAVMPDGQVKVGSSWTKKQNTGSTLPLLLNNTYTLKSIDNGIATIDVSGTVSIDPENATTSIQGMDATFFMDGTHTGTLHMEVATGWVESASFNDDIAGSITIASNAQMPDGMTIPIEMKNVTTVTSE